MVFFDCNFRFTYGLRCLGKGHEGGKLLCGVMNMPPPIARFDKLNNVLLNRVTEVSKRVMKNAVEEVMNVKQNENCDGVISDKCFCGWHMDEERTYILVRCVFNHKHRHRKSVRHRNYV